MGLKTSYNNKEVKEAIAEVIRTIKNLEEWIKVSFDPLPTVKTGDMWFGLTKKQRQMVVAALSTT